MKRQVDYREVISYKIETDNCIITQFYRIKGGGGSGPPPPIIFERQILPQQTIYPLEREFNSDFMNTLRNFAKSVFAHIFVKFEYFAKVILCSKSPDHVLQNDICSYFISLKFFEQQFRSHFAKIAHKIAKSKYFSNI